MQDVQPGICPKKRVLAAIGHQQPDEVPCDYWGTPEVDDILMHHFEVDSLGSLLKLFSTDVRYVYGSGIIYEDDRGLYAPTARYTGPSRPRYQDGSFMDIWGCKRTFVRAGSGNTYREVWVNPLREAKSVSEIEHYRAYPRPEYFDVSALRDECIKRREYAIILGGVHGGSCTIFHQCAYLRGLDQLLTDLILEPALVDALVDKVADFQYRYHARVFEEIGDLVDIVMFADDYGTQTDLMMSIGHFRRFFKEPTRRIIELAKKYCLKIMFHSDGNIRKLIPDFIDMGIDILNPIQNVGQGMSPTDLKLEYGSDICFHGAIDVQQTLRCISRDKLRAEVRRTIETLGKGGGYILAPGHLLQLDVPLENIVEFYKVPRML